MPSPLSVAPRFAPAAGPDSGPSGRLKSLLRTPSVFLFVILAAQLMVVLDTTIVNVALPHIQEGLGLSGGELSWVINGYLLTFGGLLLLGARSGDLLGRRRTFLAGIAIFTVSSLFGGLAVSGWMLLSARALQGVGAALAAPSSLALLTTIFTDGPQRVRAIGLFTTVSAAGGAIGLVAGGALTQLVSWRWVMFVNVPIGIAVLLVGRIALEETPRRTGHFDIAGALTSTLGMVGIVFGLVEAGTKGWASPLTVGSIALGLFVRIETRAEEPIVPLRLFSSGTRTTANVSRGLMYAGMYGMFFFVGQFMQDVQGFSPLRTGLCFLPVPASVFLSSQVVSKVLINRIRPKALIMTGISLTVVALLMSTQLHAGASYAQIFVSLVLLGVGSGTALVPLTQAGLAGVDPADAGAASGLVNVTQQVGAALGLAVLVTVLSAAAGHAQLQAGTGVPTSLVHGLDATFAVAALFGIAALVMVALLVHLPAPVRAGATAPDDADADAERAREAACAEYELVDGEGYEWSGPELVA
jgi:EmrB/QacA subfamily drug resistance transporter